MNSIIYSASDREIFQQARDFLYDYTHWAVYHLAVSRHGREVPVNSRHAVRWCAIGAIRKFIYQRVKRAAARDNLCLHLAEIENHVLAETFPQIHGHRLIYVNDRIQEHSQLMEALDDIIDYPIGRINIPGPTDYSEDDLPF